MKFRLLFVLFALLARNLFANNVQVKNVQVLGANKIKFTINWQNSWKLEGVSSPGNHDAVWVFIKFYEQKSTGAWEHLNVSANSADHITGIQLQVNSVSDGKGVFLERKNSGTGNIADEEVTLQMAGFLPVGNYSFKVFAIEMVWVPQGAFFVGDGASQNRFRRGDKDAPFHIKSTEKMVLGKDSTMLNDTGKFAPAADIPASFPNGYNGFYCMKYELSQLQYVDFLNCLSYIQQQKRTVISPVSAAGSAAMNNFLANRNGIIIEQPGQAFSTPAIYACNSNNNKIYNEQNDGQSRACNFLNWADVAAFLDWAALRPLTEFEFEKVCRGPEIPFKHEFAWGTDKVLDANSVADDGSENESVTEKPTNGAGLASHGYNGPQGPLRNGFAATNSNNRIGAGAAYFGAMEMSGNLWEMCVTVDAQGLKFTGLNGDGNLNENGEADVENWPLADGTGAGFRGGAWNSGILPGFRDLAISDRFYAGMPPSLRRNTNGGRGGR